MLSTKDHDPQIRNIESKTDASSVVSALGVSMCCRAPVKKTSPAAGIIEESVGASSVRHKYRLFWNTDEQCTGQLSIVADKRRIVGLIVMTEKASRPCI